MEKLEQKTADICINHYRAKMHVVLTEEDLHHANCTGHNYQCPNYRASKNYYVNLNHGKPVLVFR